MISCQQAAEIFRQCRLRSLLDESDTAFIVFSIDELRHRAEALKAVFPQSTLHAAAIKTNPHPAILRHLLDCGLGLEAASYEELELAESAGIEPAKLVFDSPVKTRLEIDQCSKKWPGLHVNANSIQELQRYGDTGNRVLGLRINPLRANNSPELFDVSQSQSKFGVAISQKDEIIKACLQHKVQSLHVHCGSEVQSIEDHAAAIASIVQLADDINAAAGTKVIRQIDIGGGLRWSAGEEGLVKLRDGLSQQVALFERYEVITEFGQWLHASAGFVVSRVEYYESQPEGPNTAFLHVGGDLFMRDVYTRPRNFRYFAADRDGRIKDGIPQATNLAGPLCFAGDFIAHEVLLPELREGDFVLIFDTGANTYGLWSRHCSRAIPKVIGVRDGACEVLSERRTIDW